MKPETSGHVAPVEDRVLRQQQIAARGGDLRESVSPRMIERGQTSSEGPGHVSDHGALVDDAPPSDPRRRRSWRDHAERFEQKRRLIVTGPHHLVGGTAQAYVDLEEVRTLFSSRPEKLEV